jgi:hypothetical protein
VATSCFNCKPSFMIWTFHWGSSGYRERDGLSMITHRDRQETHTKLYPGTLETTLWRTERNLKVNNKIDHKNCVEVEWVVFFGLGRGQLVVLYDWTWCWSYWCHIRKVKQSRNRPGLAQRVPGGLGSKISMTSAHECGEVVSLTHRLPSPPGNVPGIHFH